VKYGYRISGKIRSFGPFLTSNGSNEPFRPFSNVSNREKWNLSINLEIEVT
jgi:hypothetical protein